MNKKKSNLVQTPVKTPKYINPQTGLLLVYFMVLLFYLVPALGLAAARDVTRFSDYLYLYASIFYTIIVLSIIILDGKSLNVFQDHLSLWTIVLGCFLAASQGGMHDTIYQVFLVLLGIRLSIYIFSNRKSLKLPSWKLLAIGLLWSVVTIGITAGLLFVFNPTHQSFSLHLLTLLLNTFLYQLSFVVIIEEACFRGLLFSLLVLNGYQEDKALMLQGILFWGIHYENRH